MNNSTSIHSPKQRVRHPKRVAGMRFGKLVLISKINTAKNYPKKWLCRCDCGTKIEVADSNLVMGLIRSCGCLPNIGRTTHGMSYTRTYRIWASMLQRCENPNEKSFPDYGRRGISVCERWHDFPAFLSDMGECPKGMSIDRIDNNRGYEPSNCRWTTLVVQANNKRSNKFITFNGKTQTYSQWAKELGISRQLIYRRIKAGLPLSEILSSELKPSGRKKK